MTCLHCGTPLSPFYTSCPRCGAAIEGETAGQAPQQAFARAFSPQNAFQAPISQDNPLNISTHQYTWGNQTAGASWEGQGHSFAQSTALYQPAQNATQGQLAFPVSNPITPSPPSHNTAQLAPSGALTFAPQPTSLPGDVSPSRVGFMLAGLCLVAGGLILVLVYVMSLSLSST